MSPLQHLQPISPLQPLQPLGLIGRGRPLFEEAGGVGEGGGGGGIGDGGGGCDPFVDIGCDGGGGGCWIGGLCDPSVDPTCCSNFLPNSGPTLCGTFPPGGGGGGGGGVILVGGPGAGGSSGTVTATAAASGANQCGCAWYNLFCWFFCYAERIVILILGIACIIGGIYLYKGPGQEIVQLPVKAAKVVGKGLAEGAAAA